MVFFNGDRICARGSRKNKELEFGRIQEYVDVEETSYSESDELSNYGDVLSSDDTLFSSCNASPPAGGRKSLRRVPLLHLMAPLNKRKASSLASLLGIEGENGVVPGLTSPMMKRSRSQPDLGKALEMTKENVKKQVVWDNPKKPETEILGEQDENVFKVLDRKFVVGQWVTRQGRTGQVVDIVPLATVHVPFCEPENRHESAHVIPDLPISEILPISPIFSGVTIEYNGWLGQVTDVQRRTVYKLEDSTYLTRTFFDSNLAQKTRIAPAGDQQLNIQNKFSYPFMPNSEMPFTGKVEKFSKAQIQRLRQAEEDDKENNNRYATRSKTGSSNTATSIASSESGRKSRTDRGDSITAIVESVSIQSIKVRWTGRLPAYLIKAQESKAAEKEKATKRPTTTQQASLHNKHHRQLEMPSTSIRSPDVKKVRPLYVHPSTFFEKKGLCLHYTDKKNEEIMIPSQKFHFDLFTTVAGDNNASSEVVAPFNLSTVTLSSSREAKEKRKDSVCLSQSKPVPEDFGGGKGRKRSHDDEDTAQQDNEESSRAVIVCKHFVRHVYKVVFDESKKKKKESGNKRNSSSGGGMFWGTQLHPVSQQEHKLCLGLIHSHLYVVPRESNCMHGKCDYGVVYQKPDDNSLVVDWLKIQSSGNVSLVRTLKCQLYEVDKHPRFNELHEGRVVVRAKDAERFKGAIREFCFGTIVSVNRWCALGQISVYCPLQEKTVELWPHMVELFVGMSFAELIALKVVGQNKILNENLNATAEK